LLLPWASSITRVTRQVPLVEQELLTLPEHLSSFPGFSRDSCCSIFSFICDAVLFILFWNTTIDTWCAWLSANYIVIFTDYDFLFDIFKLIIIGQKEQQETHYLKPEERRNWFVCLWNLIIWTECIIIKRLHFLTVYTDLIMQSNKTKLSTIFLIKCLMKLIP
jgi:hypothetical protein